MSELAVVLLAHQDGLQVQRLVGALDGLPVFLHCDIKTPPADYRQMASLSGKVRILPRTDARLSSWSLVEAELVGLRAALSSTKSAHIAVMSGSCYPLMPTEEILTTLKAWRGQSYFYNRPLPFQRWNTDRRKDGGEWRMRYPFLTWRGHVVMVKGFPVHWPVKRRVPAGLELSAASQWKIYAREHVEMLLRVVDTRPDLIRFWRSSFVPDESFAASILRSAPIVGSHTLQTCLTNPWYLEWASNGDHPRWLDESDVDHLSQLRFGPKLTPEVAMLDPASRTTPYACLFARKISVTRAPKLLDRIDSELRK